MALAIREDLVGVTSFVRALGLREKAYKSMLNLFHSKAFSLQTLTEVWMKTVFLRFSRLEEGGLPVVVGDGIKVGKEGRKMPAVKSLHQESSSNSKSEFIMGHSFQALSLLATAGNKMFAVPLVSRIQEGIVRTNRDKRTTVDHMATMIAQLVGLVGGPVIFVADNFYGNQKIVKALGKLNSFLVTRLKSTAVAEFPAKPRESGKRGRTRKYGSKVKLAQYFNQRHLFTKAPSPVYGEQNVSLDFYCIDLLWRKTCGLVRFVLVAHPTRGKAILMTTKLDLDPLRVIALYGYRWKIELSFKTALHVIGAYAYHFWMKDMKRIDRRGGNQYLHRKPKDYRDQVARKLEAYHRFVQLGCVAHGLHQHLAANMPGEVWSNFKSWLRTMDKTQLPSEMVVSYALRASLPRFMLAAPKGHDIEKFLSPHIDFDRMPGAAMAA
jgi:hypothetical protein